ncbi:hypothetical protein QNH20_07785 [Neobacillus sp. WH10]|uniref:hypothetical protein n=1 Tax=Neobacillus sp. WH10 TaxID=3047873 RepID=UPI0024C10E19|nr:hypothetical protein [Neobacillus sp. WH10]WHY79021.1 hypothetical protein QNH20_07785 [Neobacillus sp. WH10]
MKRIDVLLKIFKIEFDIKYTLELIYDGGIKDIYEIFNLNFVDAAYVLLNYEVFENDLFYNVNDMFSVKWRLDNFVRICLMEQPSLIEEMNKEEIVNTVIELAKIERNISKINDYWRKKGVIFDFLNENITRELIDEILGYKLGDVLFDFLSGSLQEGDLRKYIIDIYQQEF